MSEAEQTSSQVLQIEYRNQVNQVPLAQNVEELKSHLKNRVLPALTRLRNLNTKVDLAISEYVYGHDESLKGQEESTRRMLDALGGEDINEEDLISRRKGFSPILSDRLSWRKEEDSVPVDDEHLPFAARTYVIGPMLVSEEVYKPGGGPTLEEDVKASTFFIGDATAVDGATILEASGKKQTGRVTNFDLVRMIETLI